MLRVTSVIVAGLMAGALAAAGSASAQTYPSKPVRMISAYAPGGGAEIGLRYIGAMLQDAGWPTVVIENKPGGGGAVGALATLQSPADGYTIFQCDVTSFAISVSLNKSLPYDPLNDFEPIMMTFAFPSVLVVPAGSSAKTAADLIEMAKTKPGGLTYASQGVGSGGHLLGTMFQKALGKDMTHAPYKGSGQAMPDVAAGRVDFIFTSYGSARAYLDGKTVRPLAVTSKKRMPELPDIPTMTELGYAPVFFDVWMGLCAPKGTPAAVVKTVHDKVDEVIRQPAAVKKLQDTGLYVDTNTPVEFREQIKSEISRLGAIIKEAGVEPQ